MIAEISKIKIVNRIRKEITKIDELAADISANGLLNPVTVMSLDNGEFQLLAGLRRLKAFESLGHDEITVNIVTPANAEAALRIEISENEQREPFTFTEKMDFARVLDEIESAKAKERMSLGGKGGISSEGVFPGTPLEKGKRRKIIADKIGMSGSSYDRAKYIAENAPLEVIEELDNGKRFIRPTYEEIRALEKAENAKANETLPDSKEEDSTHNDSADYDDIAEEDEADIQETYEPPVSADDSDNDVCEESALSDVPEDVPIPPAQNPVKRSAAGTIFGTPTRRSQEDSKEYREDLRQIRDDVNKMAEYSRTHKRTIEEFQQVFRANAERFVDSLEQQFKFMDAETWATPTNKEIACSLIDEMVQAITNFKEEFLQWK